MTETNETQPLSREELEAMLADASKSAAAAALEAVEEKQRLEAEAKEAAEAEATKLEEEVRAKVVEEMTESGEYVPARKGGFNVASKFNLGASDKEEYQRALGLALFSYVKTGNSKPWRGLGQEMVGWGSMEDDIIDPGQFGSAAIKAAFEEGTAGEGGVLVPNDFFPGIIAKRDQVSWPRRAGVSVQQTNRDIVDIPVENAKQGTFAITGEEAAYDTDAGPSFSNLQITVHKFTRTHVISEELEADEAVGFPTYLQNSLGRAWGLTENQYVAVGTGSSQPQGVMIGADTDDTLTLDTGLTITTDEIPKLFYKLQQQYRSGDECIWLMNEATEAVIVGRLSSNQLEVGGPIVTFSRDPADGGIGRMMGYRVFNDANVTAITSTGFDVMFGNMSFYRMVERQGLVITRNPYLYEATGQVGIFARARWGGAVAQDEAFKVAFSA